MRALDELGIASVAVYSELDRDAPHVARAGEAYNLGDGPAAENYLSIEKILDVAARSGAEAIHPGYGFLAENAPFAQACEDAGIVFIGPPASAIEAMGSKTRARELMQAAGVPIVPGTTEPVATVADALRIAKDEIGFPVAVKAAGGGGGKGFRVALTEDELEGAFEGSSREGEKFFSDATVYLERYLHDPRHVEVQVLADRHGNVIHLGERDCSIQRRHQKVIEESPAPEWVVDAEMRERIGQIGVDAAKAVDYVGAGTIEGLFSTAEGERRARVLLPGDEHARAGRALRDRDDHRHRHRQGGHPRGRRRGARPTPRRTSSCAATRSSAASTPRTPPRTSPPRPGKIGAYREPTGPGVRVDSGVAAGGEVSPMYDPMVAKLIVWDADREQATAAHAARARRIRDRGPEDADPLPPGAAGDRAVGQGRDLPDLLEDKAWLKTLAFPTRREAPPQAPRRAPEGRADLRRRGLRQALRRARPRPAVRGAAPGAAQQRRPRRRRAARGARKRAERKVRAAAAVRTRCPRRCRATCGRCSSSRATPSRRASCSASSRR